MERSDVEKLLILALLGIMAVAVWTQERQISRLDRQLDLLFAIADSGSDDELDQLEPLLGEVFTEERIQDPKVRDFAVELIRRRRAGGGRLTPRDREEMEAMAWDIIINSRK